MNRIKVQSSPTSTSACAPPIKSPVKPLTFAAQMRVQIHVIVAPITSAAMRPKGPMKGPVPIPNIKRATPSPSPNWLLGKLPADAPAPSVRAGERLNGNHRDVCRDNICAPSQRITPPMGEPTNSAANRLRRSATNSAMASTPNVPWVLSCMISSRRSGVFPPQSPSKLSAIASSLIAPVTSASAAMPRTTAGSNGMPSVARMTMNSAGPSPINRLTGASTGAMRDSSGGSCAVGPEGKRE